MSRKRQTLDETVSTSGMNIYIKTFTGKTIVLNVEPNDTIQCVKEKIQDKHGTLVERQILFYVGKQLENESDLPHYGIWKDSTCHLLVLFIKIIVNNVHVLWLTSKNTTISHIQEILCNKYNIPINRQSIKCPPNYKEKLSTCGSYETPIETFNVTLIKETNEITLFVNYLMDHKKMKKFICIQKDKPLHEIGNKLNFYHPMHNNEQNCLILQKSNDSMLDTFKTAKDYNLKDDTILNVKINIAKLTQYQSFSTLDNKLVFGYIHMISTPLLMVIPTAIIKICCMFYAKYDHNNVVFFIGYNGIRMLDIDSGKNFKMKLNFDVRQKYSGGCIANNVKLAKYRTLSLKNVTNYDAILLTNSIKRSVNVNEFCYQQCQCTLIVYDPLQFNNIEPWSKCIAVDGFEVKVPILKDIITDWNGDVITDLEKISPIYDSKNNSFYVSIVDNIFELNLNANDMEWIQLVENNKLIKRQSVSLLCENNNFYRIGGGNYALVEVQDVEMYSLQSKNVKRLPDIPIDFCQGQQSDYISQKDQIVVGWRNANVLDLNKEIWLEYKNNTHFSSKDAILWVDNTNCDIIYICNVQNLIEWTDIREHKPKWNALWNTPFRQLINIHYHEYSSQYSLFS
eukprot:115484_1